MVFQLSYVGDSSEAKGFIHDISVDPEVKDMVYCNLKSLDEQLANKSSGMKNEYVSIFFSFREWGGGAAGSYTDEVGGVSCWSC